MDVADWNIKDWLEALAYVVAIVGGIAASVIYFNGIRHESIATTRNEIVRSWTNEGAIDSEEFRFITLELENLEGEIIGSLSTNAHNRILEVHANVGWFSTILSISELQGRRVIPIAEVKIKLIGNNNRLGWSLIGNQGENLLPKESVLWPSIIGVSR